MSCSYAFYLRVGFEIPTEELKKVFVHKTVVHEEGAFHMEDRFDPKTGAKLAPVQVWDKRSKTKTDRWWVIDGKRYEDWEDEIMTRVFAKLLGCNVDNYWQAYGSDGGGSFGFYPHPPGDVDVDSGKFSISNTSMSYQQVKELEPKLIELKQKLLDLGINPGEATIFLGEVSG